MADQESTTAEVAQDASEVASTTNTGTEAETQTDASETSTDSATKFDADYVARLRKENAANRVKAKALEAERDALKTKVDEHDSANLTDLQRLEAERNTFADQAKKNAEKASSLALKYEAIVLANKLNIVDPDAAVKLLDEDSIEWNDAGSPTNLQSLLETLVESKPYLKAPKTVAPNLNATNGASTGRTDSKGSALTLDEIKKMSPQEQAKRQDEVFAFMKNFRGSKK